MPGIIKHNSMNGCAEGGGGGGRRQETTRAPAPRRSPMSHGIHPDDRELFSLAGIDWSDVPDLQSTQQRAKGALQAQLTDDNKDRAIAFKDDEPDHFLASITAKREIRLTIPFNEAQRKKGAPNQIEAAEKAGCGLPLFVYGSSLFPEVLCQQLGVPVANAMHMANNYIPAVAPWCTRYCLAGDVPLAAMVHNQDAQLNSYLREPRKESHVRGALVFGLHQQSKQMLDICYGAKPKDDGGQGTWGPWKRVAIGVRCQLNHWDRPGWVVAETYIWNGSIARLHCFQQDLTWTPHLFADFCQQKRREAAAKGVEYKGPPLWTSDDVREWEKRRPAEIEQENKRIQEDVEKRHTVIGRHDTEGIKKQMQAAQKRREPCANDGQMPAAQNKKLKVSDAAGLNRVAEYMNKSQTDKANLTHGAPTKTQNDHKGVEMKDARDGPNQQAAGTEKKHQEDGKQLQSRFTVR